MRTALIAVVFALSLCAVVEASTILISAPSVSISNSNSSGSFTVTVTFDGNYQVAGYDVKLKLTPESGATGGLAFTGFSAASSNYVLTAAHYGVSGTTDANHIFAQDSLLTGTELMGNQTRNMITVNYAIAPGTLGEFDIGVSIVDGFNDGESDFSPQNFHSGQIEVTPEPATLALLAVGGVCAVLKRRR